jgi:hypothetical protein
MNDRLTQQTTKRPRPGDETMQTTTYPRLPELEPRRPDETAEAYGLRALRFIVATDTTATVPDDALALAGHTYRLAIANADLLATTIDRLADTERRIAAALRLRQRLDSPKDAPGCLRNDDRPVLGPMAPLTPTPRLQPPAPARQTPDFAF